MTKGPMSLMPQMRLQSDGTRFVNGSDDVRVRE